MNIFFFNVALAQETLEPLKLGIPIPGLQFATILYPKGGFLEVPYLAQYIATAAQYLIGISVVAAAVMIVYGGFRYIVGSTITGVQRGKAIVTDAIIGLLFLLGAYTILQVVNPNTLTLRALKLTVVKPVEENWFAVHGTADPVFSAEAAQEASENPIPGATIAVEPVPGVLGEKVDISDIPFDKSLGGPANMNNYCTPKSSASAAKTYENKTLLLVKAVLGWHNVCVKNRLCAYCQGCYTTIPTGEIVGLPAANYVVKQCIDRNIRSCIPENLWYPSETECIAAYKKSTFSVNAMPQCVAAAQKAYKEIFIGKFRENNLFAGDCGSFAFRLYTCANAAWKDPPKEEAWDAQNKKWVKTPYLSEKSIDTFKNEPNMILAAHMNEDLIALAGQKGGMKFGDLVYTSGGTGSFAAHWSMYTGGREDVPFSFIEMGGGSGVNVPGLGQVSGVHTQPPGKTIQDYINAKIKSGTYKANSGLVFVWRPYGN